MNKNVVLITTIVVLIATNVLALRVARPPTLSYPITEEQISQLNRFLEDSWNIQNGRGEMDIVTVSKQNAREGEAWLIYTAPTVFLQYKGRGIVWTLRP